MKIGMRKWSFGIVAISQLFVVAMWAPGDAMAVAPIRAGAVQAILAVAIGLGGAMLGENFAKKA